MEFGEKPTTKRDRGEDEKMRWENAWTAAKEGRMEDIPADMKMRFYRTIKEIKKDYMAKPEDAEGVTRVWIWGPPGCDKSRSARADYPGAYLKGKDYGAAVGVKGGKACPLRVRGRTDSPTGRSMWTITRVVEFDLADPKWHVMPEPVVVEEEVEVEEPAGPAPSADLGDLEFDIDEWFQQNYSVEEDAAITAARFM
eukprot:gene504-1911_t